MSVSLLMSAIMFASGVAALLFETLWFRQAGLSFGNSVWASSLILSSFMAGLALGNGLIAQRGDRIRHPIRLYAVLEVSIAASGCRRSCVRRLAQGVVSIASKES